MIERIFSVTPPTARIMSPVREPLLINAESEYIQTDDIPGIRIYRAAGKKDPFDIFFCKTKYNAYKILMGLGKEAVETLMARRSRSDVEFMKNADSSSELTGQAI